MEVSRFEDLQVEFMARVSQTVYCAMATIDRKSHPRQRIMHPIWDGPTGWIISWPESHKSRHLETNPAVSLAYIKIIEKPVYVDGFAEWIDQPEEKQRIWDLYKVTPPPLGFDPQPHYGDIHHKYFGLLRIIPWRIELADLNGEPVIWRQPHV